MQDDFTNSIEIHYQDGKPIRKKTDPSDEIKKELKIDEPSNMFDDTKRQLYANLPKAQLKKDRSITARQLNQTLESYNKKRTSFKNETTHLFEKDGYTFKWLPDEGTLTTIKKPSNGLDLSYISTKLKGETSQALRLVHQKIDEHIKRTK